jgi:hypothetical protein
MNMKHAEALLIGLLIAIVSLPGYAATVTEGANVTTTDYGPAKLDSDYQLKQKQGRRTTTVYPAGTTSAARGGDTVSLTSTDFCPTSTSTGTDIACTVGGKIPGAALPTNALTGTGTTNYLPKRSSTGAYVDSSVRGVPIPGTGTFTSLAVGSKNWFDVTVCPNGDRYATGYGEAVYQQVGGAGAWNEVKSATSHTGITCAPNGDVYVAGYGGGIGIWKRTGGAGAFATLGQASRSWYGMASCPNGNVYAVVNGGDIYMQTAGAGDFAALSQTARQWHGIACAPNGDVYASEYPGDIYLQTAGAGSFAALGQTSRNWYGLAAAWNGDVYAAARADDIYVRTAGAGAFVATGKGGTLNWQGMANGPDGSLYATVQSGDIYRLAPGSASYVGMSATYITRLLTLGTPGVTAGAIGLAGSTSGIATIGARSDGSGLWLTNPLDITGTATGTPLRILGPSGDALFAFSINDTTKQAFMTYKTGNRGVVFTSGASGAEEQVEFWAGNLARLVVGQSYVDANLPVKAQTSITVKGATSGSLTRSVAAAGGNTVLVEPSSAPSEGQVLAVSAVSTSTGTSTATLTWTNQATSTDSVCATGGLVWQTTSTNTGTATGTHTETSACASIASTPTVKAVSPLTVDGATSDWTCGQLSDAATSAGCAKGSAISSTTAMIFGNGTDNVNVHAPSGGTARLSAGTQDLWRCSAAGGCLSVLPATVGDTVIPASGRPTVAGISVCLANGDGCPIGGGGTGLVCSGTCYNNYLAKFNSDGGLTDAISGTDYDPAGAASTVQGNLNTHAGTTLASGAHGGLPTLSAIGAANQALSNLSSVAVNQSLTPGSTASIDLGSTSKKWKDAHLSGQVNAASVYTTGDLSAIGSVYGSNLTSAGHAAQDVSLSETSSGGFAGPPSDVVVSSTSWTTVVSGNVTLPLNRSALLINAAVTFTTPQGHTCTAGVFVGSTLISQQRMSGPAGIGGNPGGCGAGCGEGNVSVTGRYTDVAGTYAVSLKVHAGGVGSNCYVLAASQDANLTYLVSPSL